MESLASGLHTTRDNKRFLVGVSLLFAFRAYVADWVVMPSSSMNPALVGGDYILMSRLACEVCVSAITVWFRRGNDPRRGDVVIFSSPEDGTRLVKRFIELPGDVVEMRSEALYINHQRLAYAPLPDVVPGALPRATVMLPHELWLEALPGRQHTVVALSEMRALRSFGPIIIP